MISMEKNSLNKVEGHQVILDINFISHLLTSETLTISLKNSLEVKILLPAFSMKMMISLEEVSDMALVEE